MLTRKQLEGFSCYFLTPAQVFLLTVSNITKLGHNGFPGKLKGHVYTDEPASGLDSTNYGDNYVESV